ncbi:MAG: class I SAM-dependent methyltransferase [Candidatus Hodarchaeota archaeon]
MFKRILAWSQLLKLGRAGVVAAKEAQIFLETNIINVLSEEGWFEFLKIPRTVEELIEHYQYTDKKLTQEILDALVEVNTVKMSKEARYQTYQVEDTVLIPKFFTDAITDLWRNYAKALIPRLKGKYIPFSGGAALYNWDDALSARIYEVGRSGAFTYAGTMKRTGKLLDVGCGNGYGTTIIWSRYYKRNRFYPGSNMEIIGIDINEELLRIAREERILRLSRLLGKREEELQSLEPHFPKFIKGTVLDIPFENETFDMVFLSQVLHWTDAQRGLRELLRVTKPEGIIFGAQGMYPTANKFADFHVTTVENATGFFYKEDFQRWAKAAGAKRVYMTTPLTIYKILKS